MCIFSFTQGIQNIGIAFMVLLYSLPAPENTQAVVIPLVVAYLSIQPFHVILLYRFVRRHCCETQQSIEQPSIDAPSKVTHHMSEYEGQSLNEQISLQIKTQPVDTQS
jgi:hypothetical protein